jgi:cell division protein FtsQ
MFNRIRRINRKAILYGFIWVVCLGGVGVLMSFIEVKKDTAVCKDVKVIIPGNQTFIERAEIDNIIRNVSGPLVGRKLSQINIHRLEKALKANPFVEFAKVYADMTGVIQVQIKQREPVVRIFNLANQDFYIDKNGLKVPVSQTFTARVLVANGNIMEYFSGTVDTLKTTMARDIFNTALFIENDTLWRDQIEQIYVNNKSEIELVPRVGNHKIILGSADSLKTKFTNLLMFYKKAMPKVGWDTYKTINIKYTNQVVCVKNVIDSTAAAKPMADSLKIKATKDTVIKI